MRRLTFRTYPNAQLTLVREVNESVQWSSNSTQSTLLFTSSKAGYQYEISL